MNEITKLYENAEVKADRIVCYRGFDRCIDNDFNCHCHNEKPCKDAIKIYPQLIAEKQLLLIQWLLDKTDLYLHRNKSDFTYSIATGDVAVNKYKCFEESIAELINAIWQDLTQEAKQQIRKILNE